MFWFMFLLRTLTQTSKARSSLSIVRRVNIGISITRVNEFFQFVWGYVQSRTRRGSNWEAQGQGELNWRRQGFNHTPPYQACHEIPHAQSGRYVARCGSSPYCATIERPVANVARCKLRCQWRVSFVWPHIPRGISDYVPPSSYVRRSNRHLIEPK